MKKQNYSNNLQAAALRSDYILGTPLAPYFQNNSVEINNLSSESWVILPAKDYLIKNTIAKVGTQLKDWDIEFYRGFLTGHNEAFFLDKSQKDFLIKNEPNASSLIKPLVRGRNIRKYAYTFDDLYVLFIPWHFPLVEEDIVGASKEAEEKFKEEYPFVFKHLLKP
ncbi:MAG: hypothetical protein M5T52_24445 [Ignavibacteriaceae bacterium]|nr:hypothetical protein [Ignavibacteriaceae bacterium]